MKIYTDAPEGMTVVPNAFIDRFMPHANGEFVKVYLYLLRCADTGQELSLSSIADIFDHTEKDVRRALAYWEKQGLLRTAQTADGELASMTFLAPPVEEAQAGRTADRPGDAAAPLGTAQNRIWTASQGTVSDNPAAAHSRTWAAVPERESSGGSAPDVPDRGHAAQPNAQDELRQLFFIAEQYMRRPLTSAEQDDLVYYYDTLHFSQELIDYLLEYCISKGSSSRHYIRTVALGWAEAGVSTVAEAKRETTLYNRNYYTVLNAFGIRNRAPAEPEQRLMSRWFNDFGFTIDLVLEACRRTVLKTGQPRFDYADGILEKWHKSGVTSMADVERLDAQHKSEQKKKEPRPAKSASNRFNNFTQREYDYDKLEKQLLSQ